MLKQLTIPTLLVGVGVAALSAGWSRDPMVPAGVRVDPQAGTVRASESVSFADGLRADVSCWLSGHFLTVPDAMNPSQAPVRVISVSAIFNVKQVLLTHVTVNGTVDGSKSEPFVAEATSIDLGLAKVFAAQALGLEVPESQGMPSGPYTVEIRPITGKTWAAVVSSSDLEVVKK